MQTKVGRSKSPTVLNGGFNRLNCPGQYAKKWSILVNTNLSGRLTFLNGCLVVDWDIRSGFTFYLLKKYYCSIF